MQIPIRQIPKQQTMSEDTIPSRVFDEKEKEKWIADDFSREASPIFFRRPAVVILSVLQLLRFAVRRSNLENT
jgi:hypothetical protein